MDHRVGEPGCKSIHVCTKGVHAHSSDYSKTPNTHTVTPLTTFSFRGYFQQESHTHLAHRQCPLDAKYASPPCCLDEQGAPEGLCAHTWAASAKQDLARPIWGSMEIWLLWPMNSKAAVLLKPGLGHRRTSKSRDTLGHNLS